MDLTITEFRDRKSSIGTVVKMSWEQLKDKLRIPIVTMELKDEYAAMSNEQRTEIKDVGGFVGGELTGGKRSRATVKSRTLLTIDADEAKLEDIYDFLRNPCTGTPLYFCHTTHTSTKLSLRLRWIFPLLRPVDPAEYRKLISIVSLWVGEKSLDASTDQPERLMFWPSACIDGDFEYWEGGISPLDPDALFNEDIEPEEVEIVEEPTENFSDDLLTEFDEIIGQGGRNHAVFSKAVALHHQGLNREQALKETLKYNHTYCRPALPDKEVYVTFNSAWRYDATSITPKDDFADMGKWSDDRATAEHSKQLQNCKKIKLESFKSLVSRDIAPPTYVVDNLLSTGLTILASPPKYGKSWFCMALGLDVANGADFLGMPTHKNGVVYMALEDGEYRLKDRGLKVNGGRPLPENFYLANEAPSLGEGLIYSLEDMCADKDIGLIIIDTLQKVRSVAGKTEGVYGFDYRELGSLQKFAIKKNIALVVVHHLNKGGDDTDFVNRLNGSTGVSGAADSIITLTRSNRGDKDTRMSIVGRDINERNLVLRMNWAKWRWENLGEEQDVREDESDIAFRNDPVVKTIVYELDEAESLADESYNSNTISWSCTSKGLLEAVNRHMGNVEYQTPSSVGLHVSRIANELLTRLGICYKYDVDGSTKRHVFERMLM